MAGWLSLWLARSGSAHVWKCLPQSSQPAIGRRQGRRGREGKGRRAGGELARRRAGAHGLRARLAGLSRLQLLQLSLVLLPDRSPRPPFLFFLKTKTEKPTRVCAKADSSVFSERSLGTETRDSPTPRGGTRLRPLAPCSRSRTRGVPSGRTPGLLSSMAPEHLEISVHAFWVVRARLVFGGDGDFFSPRPTRLDPTGPLQARL